MPIYPTTDRWRLLANRIQLQQVILNLTMNAIDAMSSVTGRRLLTIATGIDENRMVRMTVEDTGSGIDPAHLDRIFEPFFTTKSTGMGLGLCICRSIVETHGGKLWASPRSPFGTQFKSDHAERRGQRPRLVVSRMAGALTRGVASNATPRGLFGNIGLIAVHSKSVSS